MFFFYVGLFFITALSSLSAMDCTPDSLLNLAAKAVLKNHQASRMLINELTGLVIDDQKFRKQFCDTCSLIPLVIGKRVVTKYLSRGSFTGSTVIRAKFHKDGIKGIIRISKFVVDNEPSEYCLGYWSLSGQYQKGGKHISEDQIPQHARTMLKNDLKPQKDSLLESYGINNLNHYGRISESQFHVRGGYILDQRNYCVYIHDIREAHWLQSFFTECISLSQLLLLSAIDHAKKQKRCLALTEKEQKIYDELLPVIRESTEAYVISSRQQDSFANIMKNLLVKPECRDMKYKK